MVDPVCINSSVLWNQQLTQYSTSKYAFVGFFYAFAMLACVVCPFTFWWFRPRYARLRVRQTALVVSTALGVAFQANAGILMSFLVPYASTPCALRLFLLLFTVPLIGGVMYARLVIFFFMSSFAKLAAIEGRVMISSSGLETDENEVEQQLSLSKSIQQNIGFVFKGARALFFSSTGQDDRARFLWALRFLVSPVGVGFIVALIQIPFMVLAAIIIGSRPEFIRCYGCVLSPIFTPFAIISGVICFLGLLAAFRVRNFKDPWGLKREVWLCIASVILMFLSFILAFLTPFDPIETWDWQGPQTFCCTSILICQSLVQVALAANSEVARPLNRNRVVGDSTIASRHETNNIEAPTGPKDLKGILAVPRLQELFEKHLVDELAIESLLFYQAAAYWKKTFGDTGPELRKTRAKKLYSIYIDLRGLYPINIPDAMFKSLREKLSVTDVEPTFDVFDDAMKEVTKLMQSGSVPRFLKSNAYRDYLEHGKEVEGVAQSATATSVGGGGGGSRHSRGPSRGE